MITVEGLTAQQHRLADMIWNCDSQEDVERFITALPPEYKQDALTVRELMIAAVMDQQEVITDYVKDLIRGISRS